MSLAFQKKKVNKAELTEIIRGIYEAHDLPVPDAPAAPAAVLDPAPAVTYYHEPAEGMYHAVRHFGPGLWGVALNLDQATGGGRTYAFRPTKAQCLAVLRSLAPAAVELPGLPAWLR